MKVLIGPAPSSRRSSCLQNSILSAIICAAFASTVSAQTFTDPPVTATFSEAVQGFSVIRNYAFGTAFGRTVKSVTQLGSSFTPYGPAGAAPINYEWQRYQPFNNKNFVFRDSSLDLTATIPSGGGLFAGGINSGQIWSKEAYQPGKTGAAVYAFEIRMRLPGGPGVWSGSWIYTQQASSDDTSEIDNPEFFVMKWATEFDWTGFNHGPGLGDDIYSIKNTPYTWHPGLNFSADYHNYQMVWTPDAVYKYVDGTLVYAQKFKWTSRGPGSLAVTLAVGTSDIGNHPGLQPTSLSQFPTTLSIDHITIWSK